MLETVLPFVILAAVLIVLALMIRSKKDTSFDDSPIVNKLDFIEKTSEVLKMS